MRSIVSRVRLNAHLVGQMPKTAAGIDIQHVPFKGPAASVTDVVLTHADPDHVGGLADLPHARVHLSEVHEGEGVLILVHYGGRDLSRHDSAEHAIAHASPPGVW